MEKIIVKQLPNPENPQLGMKYIGATEYLPPKINRDGKLITGLDEDSVDITSLPEPQRTVKSKEIKKERQELERFLGRELGPNSDYWEGFYVLLTDETTLDPTNPKDRLTEKFLLANRYVAPSEDAIKTDEDFYNCVFFFHRETEVLSKKAKNQKIKDKAASELVKLSEGNTNHFKIVASYVLRFDTTDLEPDIIYQKLSDYINLGDKELTEFIEATAKSPEDLQTKIILDQAIKKRLVTARGGIHRRGEIIYGNSYDEALEYLCSIEHAGELSSLQREVKSKK